MAHNPWTEADNIKLKNLAGSVPTKEIAACLGRSMGATVVQASKLKLSLSMRRKTETSRSFSIDPGPSGLELDAAELEKLRW